MQTDETIQSLLTDTDKILSDTISCIDGFMENMNKLGSLSITYSALYDKYSINTEYDISLLKEKMKDTVIKAVSDEL